MMKGIRGFTVHGSYPCGAQAVQGFRVHTPAGHKRFGVHGSRFRGLTIHHPLSPPALNIDRFSEYGIKVTA